ncbi:hypothetical protein N9M10_04395 [Hellea sp.]|nr:hypothetical protein [Hellea sp.]
MIEMKKNKLVKIVLLSLLSVGMLFLIGLFYYAFEYHKSYPIPLDEVRNYELSLNENGDKVLLFINDSPHSMLHFQGANANKVGDSLYLELKYCSKPNLLCSLDIVNPVYNSGTQNYSLILPDSSSLVYLDFGADGAIEVPQIVPKLPSP